MDPDRLRAWCERWGVDPAAAGDLLRTLGTESTDSAETFIADITMETPGPVPLPGRYALGEVVGRGGTGEVHAATDLLLDREVALKILLPRHLGHPAVRARFLDEARLTASLQHPGVVPIHDLGMLPDGRPFFAMQLVRGPTLKERITEVHAASTSGAFGATADGWSLRRLVEAFRRVCETVACAHAAGIVHRDLKPANVVVGAHGETRVLDWGLAGSAESTTRGGTPAYMAPEQARGEAASPRTDVYALGAVLYEILAGRPPFDGEASSVLGLLRSGATPVPADRVRGPRPPPALLAVCRACLESDPALRPADAGEVAREVGRWLDDLDRAAVAEAELARASALPEVARAARREATGLRATASTWLRAVPTWAPEVDKAPAWDLQDRASALEARALRIEAEHELLLRHVLALAPEHRRAAEGLVEVLVGRQRSAESAGDEAAADRAATELGRIAAAADGGFASIRARTWLDGRARLRLDTTPGAEVVAWPLALRRRRWVEGAPIALGRTPVDTRLPPGRYVLELRAEGCAPTRYPVRLERLGEWTAERPVPLVLASALGPDDVFVPEGPFLAGGDPEALSPWDGATVQCHGFVIRRHPMTFGEVVDLLGWAWRAGRRDEALAAAPRATPGMTPADPIIAFGDDGARLLPDPFGAVWEARWPCVHVDALQADALAALAALRDGLAWRLPAELEWEKAARGVDGRRYPMGDALDPAWAAVQDSHSGRALPAPIEAFPDDTSPYGVRHLAGNVRTFCHDAWAPEPAMEEGRVVVYTAPREPTTPRVYRGGAWGAPVRACRSAGRPKVEARWRDAYLGLRLARTL